MGLAGVASVLILTPVVATRMMTRSERPRPVLRGDLVFEPKILASTDPRTVQSGVAGSPAIEVIAVDSDAIDLGPKTVQTLRVRVPAAPLQEADEPVIVAAADPAETIALPPLSRPPATVLRRSAGSRRVAMLPRRDNETPAQQLFEQLLPAVGRADPAADDVVGSITAYNRPDLPAESDNRTAVYDIAAHTVYMPNGERLEAHSGLGGGFDNPSSVHIRMRGATPPNTYRLTMRESLFHGVAAVRMTPVETGRMFGRDGILAHTYMLGPRGESNGCVSFKDYNRFLAAFRRGEVTRMVVVARTAGTPASVAAARRSADVRYAAGEDQR